MSMSDKRLPLLIIVMGVSGTGKTSVANAIAKDLGFDFYEADDFHCAENKKHMAEGKPLTDEMRAPWIKSICDTLISARASGNSCVLAYSGLKRAHRQKFRDLGYASAFVLLSGEPSLIAERMKSRAGHFMPVSLLQSQISAFEEPDPRENIVSFDIAHSLPELVSQIKKYLSESFL